MFEVGMFRLKFCMVCLLTTLPGCFESTMGADDTLALLSDEFEGTSLDASWQRAYQHEGWRFDQLERLEVGSGVLTLQPGTVTWYGDLRGPLVFKSVTGDFIMSTRVQVESVSGESAPGAAYSLAGVMARKARAITPTTWIPEDEDYVFMGLGRASLAGDLVLEHNTTRRALSTVRDIPTASNSIDLRLARVGADFIMLTRDAPGQPWTVLARHFRDDLPENLQIGMIAHSDFLNIDPQFPQVHNNGDPQTTETPDLVARFDYLRLSTPKIPSALQGARLSDELGVTAPQLLEFLGGE